MAAISDQAMLKPENLFKYNGKELQHKEFSDGTGLEEYDYGARLYDPQLGRWGTLDPMTEGTPNSSPYAYVNNNPINRNDPNGMWWEDKKALEKAKKIENEIDNVNSKLEIKIEKQLARADKLENNGNMKRAEKLVGKIEDNQNRVEENIKTIGALHNMRDVHYMSFAFATNSTTVENSNGTETTTTTFSRRSDGVYIINNSGDLSNQAHEITHGGQAANGLFTMAPGTDIPIISNKTSQLSLEVEGYKANYGISGRLPFSVSGINDPNFPAKLNLYLSTSKNEDGK